ncbi:hypothetical protein L249_3297 [Ophiocordyceps polyrhachis-furcata BCC 54312]|uniref:C3HC-type domain-containing protein n=1 Tax=Ophiocordyceps polyrhachis-furcata BCC 54312 TaxID=1330021 RepID=A0A367LQB8_9HYPO|nr:hypothetical protein L249_3297 [Ophiocordyceps polyrhachis-furcata BCC 54312]
MNATKRKFNALLQGLSNPSDRPTMASDRNDDPALLLKRRRLGLSEPNTPMNKNNSIRNAAVTPSPLSSLKKIKQPPEALVKYCPADRDELLKRLSTFQGLTEWTPKPDKINEVQWAKRGWVCCGKEKIRCLLCSKELLVSLQPTEAESDTDAVVANLCELIVTAHQQDCLWRQRCCDDSLLRLSFSNDRAVIASFRQRYDELCARAAFLPYEFNLRLPADIDIDRILSLLPPDFFRDSSSPDVNRPALALALMGWQGLSHPRLGAVPNSASCHTCLRRLGLWMFKSKEVADDGSVLVPAPMEHLDPLREHRFFCPWKSADAQSRGAKPAWSMLLQTLVNDASLRNFYEGRSATTTSTSTAVAIDVASGNDADEADEKARDAKDKERWARLRKVKSLFDTKSARMLRRSVSINRPDAG